MLIHSQLGWWLGEHGDGDNEFGLTLIAALLVLVAEKKYYIRIRSQEILSVKKQCQIKRLYLILNDKKTISV